MTASDVVKLRMKIGIQEFEAEGPRDLVLAQLELWQHLAGFATGPRPTSGDGDAVARTLFSIDDRDQLVALRLRPGGQRRNADAALLLLYGYRTCFAVAEGAAVPARRLQAALAASGHRPKRIGRTLAPHIAAGWVRKGGSHKHETYALTGPGQAHAATLARQLVEAATRSPSA